MQGTLTMDSAAASSRTVGWHVSPAVDALGYAFSWVFVALPVYIVLPGLSRAGVWLLASTALLIDLHRHYTLPYVYGDRAVRRSYPVRFVLLPLMCMALLTQTPTIFRNPGIIGVPAAGAMAQWIWLTLQLLRQDQGGEFQYRYAIPLFLGSIGVASVLTWALAGTVSPGWIWLATGAGGSLTLFTLLRQDARCSGQPRGGAHWIFPLGTAAIALATGLVGPAGLALPARAPAVLLILTFTTWQTYHVLMQKYGILRIYSAKSGNPEKVPGWVDRLFVLSIVPLYLIWAGSSQLETLRTQLASGSAEVAVVLTTPLAFLGEHRGAFLLAGGAITLAALLSFAWYEWRVHRFQNAPRNVFALGTLTLYAALFPLGLVGSYLVFAAGHAIEYMVFIWAFQRRRYSAPEGGRETLGKLLKHPVAFYSGFTALVVSALLLARYSGQIDPLAGLTRAIFGSSLLEWLGWYTLYQGILHFYYDGFLWKIRRPSLRAQL